MYELDVCCMCCCMSDHDGWGGLMDADTGRRAWGVLAGGTPPWTDPTLPGGTSP